MKKLPELLAPAGSLECLKAAVCGGADAVYFGVPQFNARMKAKNFTPDELEQAFDARDVNELQRLKVNLITQNKQDMKILLLEQVIILLVAIRIFTKEII